MQSPTTAPRSTGQAPPSTPRHLLISIPTPNSPPGTTHTLETLLFGPSPSLPSSSSSPLLVILPGLTSSGLTEWTSLPRHLPPTTRTLLYNRCGFGLSSPSGPSNPPTPSIVAEELESLLKGLGEEEEGAGPWVLVAHSWAGVYGREFLHRTLSRDVRGKDDGGEGGKVVGMVLVDVCGAEWRAREGLAFPGPALERLIGGEAGLGDEEILEVMFPDEQSRRGVTGEEWDAFLREERSEGHKRQAEKEVEGQKGGEEVLWQKGHLDERRVREEGEVLGEWPLSVMQADFAGTDMVRMYEWAVRKGRGTEEERKAAREEIAGWGAREERLNRRLLGLSRRSRFVKVEGCGHNIQMQEPQAIAREILWVLEEVQKLSSAS
ncbi:MAG: hypothetical protein Q9227_000248 [Pyrenula ochraceoflavens]